MPNKKPQEEIREIWMEMKELKRCREQGIEGYCNEKYCELESKYEEIETLFGHESTLSKAIIYYLNKK